MIDLGTGNNNKINWAVENKQELIDIVETVYRGASKGRGLVVSPKGQYALLRDHLRIYSSFIHHLSDYSTRYKY